MKILFVASEKQQLVSAIGALHTMGHELAFYPEPAEAIGEDEERFGDFLCNYKFVFVM